MFVLDIYRMNILNFFFLSFSNSYVLCVYGTCSQLKKLLIKSICKMLYLISTNFLLGRKPEFYGALMVNLFFFIYFSTYHLSCPFNVVDIYVNYMYK